MSQNVVDFDSEPVFFWLQLWVKNQQLSRSLLGEFWHQIGTVEARLHELCD